LFFTPEKGRRVLSEPAQVTLPGVGSQKKQTASQARISDGGAEMGAVSGQHSAIKQEESTATCSG
jgi:hypothetical protein